MTNILILKEEGIGNAIMAIPLIRALRFQYPKIKIDILASERNYELCQMIKEIDNVYLFGRDNVAHYDVAINTQWNCGVMAKRIKEKCDKVIEIDADFKNRSEAELNLTALSQISDAIPANYWAYLSVKKKKRRRRICIHTGCYDHYAWRNRKWANEKWVELINKIGSEVCIIGGLDEIKDANEIWRQTGAVDLTNLLTLKRTAEILAESKALISIDSGMMHLAAAVKTYVVALFGPTSEIKSHPFVPEKMYSIIRIPLDCQRCYINDKAGKFATCQSGKCMKDITPDMVMESLEGKI